jgi:hypothetical protein
MVAIQINNIHAKRRPSCSKWKILLLATAATLVPISIVQIAQPVSIYTFELESVVSSSSTFRQQQTTTTAVIEADKSESLSDQRHPHPHPPPPRPPYHVIFSTGCSPQQHWLSYVFFYHALAVDQPGHVTRIASGCRYGSARDCGASLSRAVYSRRHVRAFFTAFDTRLFESTPEPKIGLQQGPFVSVSDGVKSELE